MTDEMKKLLELEKKFDAVADDPSLRPTLERMAQRGNWLIQIKDQCLYARMPWLVWLKRKGIKDRTAQVWMQIAREKAEQQRKDREKGVKTPTTADKPLTGEQYLQYMRKVKGNAKFHALEELRKEMAAKFKDVQPDERYQIHHIDCQKFDWPDRIDLIATDPPWEETELYSWLGTMAMNKLKDGGLLVCQSFQQGIDKHLTALSAAGLTYQWTFALVYAWKQTEQFRGNCFVPSWRPVLVYSKGKSIKALGKHCRVCDTSTMNGCPDMVKVRNEATGRVHKWQQPLLPWQRWLYSMTLPGQLICDPFCGGGTNAVAVKTLGSRRFIGTEKGEQDENGVYTKDNSDVANVRLSEAVEGSFEIESEKQMVRTKGGKKG